MKKIEVFKEEAMEALVESFDNEDNIVVGTVDTNDGYIDIAVGKDGYKDAVVHHDVHEEHKTPLLEKLLMDSLPDWKDVEDAWEEKYGDYGKTKTEVIFGSEGNYWRYKGFNY